MYLHDPLAKEYSYEPQNMFKVDFAFWTGKQLLAVEIDGSSHIGSESHIRKDRMLLRSGVALIHILNDELLSHGKEVVKRLMPDTVTHFWKYAKEKYRSNPLNGIPF